VPELLDADTFEGSITMALLGVVAAAAVLYAAFQTRIAYWRYIAAGAALAAVTVAGIGLILDAGSRDPVLLAGFLLALLPIKALVMLRAHQLTRRERARAAYRRSTTKCPACGGRKDRAGAICAECEWTLAAARAGTVLVRAARPEQEAA
jgi:hypothetical protein